MGLGKTLSMIALIASDQDCDAGNFPPVRHSSHPEELRSTLVIVPLNGESNHIIGSTPLITNFICSARSVDIAIEKVSFYWFSYQGLLLTLSSHVYSGRLTWFNHHGKDKLRLSRTTRPPDIVFTTYHTVEREKRDNKLSNGSIFSYHWKRIIIDEGMGSSSSQLL